MLLVQLSPLGILGKSWDKILANMLKALDTVQRGGCTFPVAKEQGKQVWGQQVGKNTLET